MSVDTISLEVAPLTYRIMERGEAILRGAVKVRTQTLASGLREDIYAVPDARAERTTKGVKWSENRGIGGSKVHLSQKERKSLERFIGEPVADAQDARAKMRVKGLRFLEPGESSYIDDTVEWADSGAEARGEPLPDSLKFPGWDRMLGRSREPIDAHALLAHHMRRLQSE